MDPSPVQAPHASQPHDVPIKTEERARPIPALQTQVPPPAAPQPQRVQRYKDKFQTLRERYETVTTTHTEYTRAVQRATEKELRLQAEINMLLDSALATAPQIHTPQQAPASTSTLTPVPAPGAPGASGAAQSSSMTTTPTPVHAQLSSPSALEAQLAPPLPPPPAHSHSHSHSPHALHVHTNGHGHAYGTNHAPPARAPGSSAGHGILNERAAETAPF